MKKRRGKRQWTPLIEESRLWEMHETVKSINRECEYGHGTEGFSLLCTIGLLLKNYPRIRKFTLSLTESRYVGFLMKHGL